jgi:hypothetical protein
MLFDAHTRVPIENIIILVSTALVAQKTSEFSMIVSVGVLQSIILTSLQDAKIERDLGTNFAVTQGDKKQLTTFHLRAETERSKAQWIDALQRSKVRMAEW